MITAVNLALGDATRREARAVVRSVRATDARPTNWQVLAEGVCPPQERAGQFRETVFRPRDRAEVVPVRIG